MGVFALVVVLGSSSAQAQVGANGPSPRKPSNAQVEKIQLSKLMVLYQRYTAALTRGDRTTASQIELGIEPMRRTFPETIDFLVFRESQRLPTERRSIIEDLKAFPPESASVPAAMVAQIEELFIKRADYRKAGALAQRLVDGKCVKDRLLGEEFKDVGLKWLMDCKMKLGDREGVDSLLTKLDRAYPGRFTTFGEKQYLASSRPIESRGAMSWLAIPGLILVTAVLGVLRFRMRSRRT